MTSDEMNMKMLMTSVPGVPGEDYPILATVLSAGETGFSCKGKIAGGENGIMFRVIVGGEKGILFEGNNRRQGLDIVPGE